MSSIQYAGEFLLKELKLHPSSGTVLDITKQVASVDLYEDVFSTAISGEVAFLDVDNLTENGPIVGQEFMTLKITTPSLDEEEINFTNTSFVIHKLGTKIGANANTQLIVLKFTTPELIRNKRVRVSKSYTDSIDKIVESIMRDKRYINTNKDLYIEPTAGVRKVISPNYHPYDFITNLATDALNKKYASSYFLFFENTKGIHFKSLDYIYEQETIGEYVVSDPGKLEDGKKRPSVQDDFQRVIDFQILSSLDMLANIQSGVLGSKIIEYNIYSKSFRTPEYKYFSDFEVSKQVESNPFYNDNVIDEDGHTIGDFPDARIHLHPVNDTGQYDASHTNPTSQYAYAPNGGGIGGGGLLFRQAKFAELNNGLNVSMRINGNTTIKCGETINLSVPITGRVHSKEFDQYYSGKYLITKLRHSFDIATKRHEILCVAAKDAISEGLEQRSQAIEPLGKIGTIDNLTY